MNKSKWIRLSVAAVLALALILTSAAAVFAAAPAAPAAEKATTVTELTIAADNTQTPAAGITRAKAIRIAVRHAKNKLHATKIRDKEAEKDTYRGKKSWDVDFEGKINGKWYDFDYDINRKTGKIMHYKYERDID